jgi:hypothetical protein
LLVPPKCFCNVGVSFRFAAVTESGGQLILLGTER